MRTVFELGCNRGNNLLAIMSLQEDTRVLGAEINGHAREEAEQNGVPALGDDWYEEAPKLMGGRFDLVFTAGLLIHISPKELGDVMTKLVALSDRYVLSIEYEDEFEQMVMYRGHGDRLWRRPYGGIYQEMGLTRIMRGNLGAEQGFGEGCTYHLMEKKNAH
jgi:hypothetical protein